MKIILAEGSVNVLSGGYACGILKDNTNNYLEITGTGYLEATASNNGAGIGDKSGGGVFAVTRKKINK